jgi:hypothetical protein
LAYAAERKRFLLSALGLAVVHLLSVGLLFSISKHFS